MGHGNGIKDFDPLGQHDKWMKHAFKKTEKRKSNCNLMHSCETKDNFDTVLNKTKSLIIAY